MKGKVQMMLVTGSIVAILSGCAGQGTSTQLPAERVRVPEHFKIQRELSQTFPEIQRSLFRHQAACGKAPEFSVDERHPGYATLIDRETPSTDLRDAVYIDLERKHDGGTRARAYSYRSNTDAWIGRVFAAITHPGVCDGQIPAPDTEEKSPVKEERVL